MADKELTLRFKADAKDAQRGAQQVGQAVSGTFKQLQQGSSSFITSTRASIEQLGMSYNRIMPMITAALDGIQKGLDLARFAEERARYMGRVGQQNLNDLRVASRGLLTDAQLLQAAARGMSGEFGLTASQMRVVVSAATALSDEGFGPAEQILAEMNDSLRTGVDGLKKYGIHAKDTGEAVDGLRKVAERSKNEHHAATRATVELANAMDEMKSRAGEAVGEVVLLAEKLRELDYVGKLTGDRFWFMSGAIQNFKAAYKELFDRDNPLVFPVLDSLRARRDADERRARDEAASAATAAHLRLLNGLNDVARMRTMHAEQVERATKASEKQVDITRDWMGELEGVLAIHEDIGKVASRITTPMPPSWWTQLMQAGQKHGIRGRLFSMEDTFAGIEPRQLAEWETRLEQLRKQTINYADTIRGMGVTAFEDLASAGGRAFAALIQGQEGAGASFAAVTGDIVRGIGTELQINAFKALGLGFLDLFIAPQKAAAEFTAAGIFEAGALLANVVGGALPSASSAASAGGGRNTEADYARQGQQQNGPTEITLKLGYGFIGDEKALGREIGRVLNGAMLSGDARTTGARRTS